MQVCRAKSQTCGASEVAAFKSQQTAIQVGGQDQKGIGFSSTWA